MTKYYFQKAYDFSEKFNFLRAFAGIFFGTRNLIFACGKADKLKESSGDYFCYATASIAILSTTSIHALKTYRNEPQKITQYEKFIFTIARMGVIFSAFNIAQLDPDFKMLIQKNNITQISYGTINFLMALFAIFSQPILEIKNGHSNLISAFVMSCPKSGIWIASMFAGILVQTTVFEKGKIPMEMDVLSVTMGVLLIFEWVLCYVVLIKKENLITAKEFIESPLSENKNQFEKIIWTLSFVLDFIRSFLSFFASIMVIPNILGLSPAFSIASKGKAQQSIYAFLFGATMLFGINNSARVVSTRLSLIQKIEAVI